MPDYEIPHLIDCYCQFSMLSFVGSMSRLQKRKDKTSEDQQSVLSWIAQRIAKMMYLTSLPKLIVRLGVVKVKGLLLKNDVCIYAYCALFLLPKYYLLCIYSYVSNETKTHTAQQKRLTRAIQIFWYFNCLLFSQKAWPRFTMWFDMLFNIISFSLSVLFPSRTDKTILYTLHLSKKGALYAFKKKNTCIFILYPFLLRPTLIFINNNQWKSKV